MTTFKSKLQLILLMLIGGFFFQYATAATVNVSNSTQLRNALSSASAGDVILLAPGTYTTSETTASFPTGDGGTTSRSYFFRGAANGTSSNKITLKSQNASNPAVLAGNGYQNSGYVLYITGNHWVVENIKVRSGAKGIILDNSNNSIIRKVEIYDIGQEGLHVRDGSLNTLIDDVNLHDLGKLNDGFGEGIYIGSDNSVWWEGDGNNTGERGRLYRRAVNNTTIKNSTIGPNITAEPFDIKEGTNNTIVENCIIYGTGVSGQNFADSHIDLKGNTARIRCNEFFQNNNTTIERAIMIVPRVNAGVPSSLTANDNYIHDNTFNLDESGVEMAVANSGAGDNYAWDNTRVPSSGNDYNSRIIESQPSGYSANCNSGGNGNGNNPPFGSVVSFRSKVNNKFVRARVSGDQKLKAESSNANGNDRKFLIVDVGGGLVALKSESNNRFVAAERAGQQDLKCNRSSARGWERYQWEQNSDGTISLKADVNDRYVSARNGGNGFLRASSNSIGNAEKFDLVIHSSKSNANTINQNANLPIGTAEFSSINLYPNPAIDQITIDFSNNDLLPTQLLLRNELGQVLERYMLPTDLSLRKELNIGHLSNGLYFIELYREGIAPEVLRFVKQR